MKRIGFTLLQVSCYLVILGGISDILITLSKKSMLPHHAHFIALSSELITPQLALLDHALIRAIGGLLVVLGIAGLSLLHISSKDKKHQAVWLVILIITIGEGNNALQMHLVDTPMFLIPLSIVFMSWIGGFCYLRSFHAGSS